jgi:branched-chain amino acid transport system substrate-binding protein
MQRLQRSWSRLVLAALVAIAAGCGTRLEKSEIISAYRGTGATGPGAGQSAGSEGFTSASDLGTANSAPVGTAIGQSVGQGTSAAPAIGSKSATASGAGATGAAGGGAGSATTPTGRAATAATRPGAQPAARSAAGTPGAPVAPGPGGPGAAAPAAGAPIVIGSVGTSSGIVGAAVGPGLPAVRAWVAATNAVGGINGHPIKHLVGDDGGDPARHRQLVQQMVERDKVVAFVFNFAPLSGQSSIDYLTQKRIPVVGEQGSSPWFYESPMFFPQQSAGAVFVSAMMKAAAAETVPQGKKKLAMLNCQEAQFCVDADRIWPGEAPKQGYEVVFRRQASLAQPDFTAECLAARNSGAEVFALAMDGNAIGRIGSACARAGFKPIYLIFHGALLVEHAADPNLEGILSPLALRGWFDTSNPVVARYQKALARYEPGQTPKDSSFMGWAAAELFQAAASKAPDPTTSPGILEGLWSLKSETLGDITYPLQFVRDQNAPKVECWFTARGSQGKWAYTEKGKAMACSK